MESRADKLEELTVIVDDRNQILGYKPRGLMDSRDNYRVSGLWAVNENNEILLALRSGKKKRDPSLWGPAVSGTHCIVDDVPQTYLSNIIAETPEELGVPFPGYFNKHERFLRRPSGSAFWTMYHGMFPSNTLFAIQHEEIENVKWITEEALGIELSNNPGLYTSATTYFFNHFHKWFPYNGPLVSVVDPECRYFLNDVKPGFAYHPARLKHSTAQVVTLENNVRAQTVNSAVG